MRQEIPSGAEFQAKFDQINQRETRLTGILESRRNLVPLIGTGEIRLGSSFEATIKVGETRNRVLASIDRISGKIADLEPKRLTTVQELSKTVDARAQQLDRMYRLIESGALTADEVSSHELEYEALRGLLNHQSGQPEEVQDATFADSSSQNVQVEVSDRPFMITVGLIPSLSPQLDYIVSMHEHKYDKSNTVGVKLKEAQQVDETERTEQQRDLIHAVEVMRKYTNSTAYQDVYTPEELNGLVERFTMLSLKVRPDFEPIESELLAIINRIKNSTYGFGSPGYESVKAVIKRAEQDHASRRGMQWDTFNRLAVVASNFITGNMPSAEMGSYLIPVQDPQPTKDHDLSAVYQFVADSYAQVVIGERSIAVDQAHKDSFVFNCEVVNAWFAQIESVLNAIDEGRGTEKLELFEGISSHGRPTAGIRLARGFAYNIREMVEAMNQRLNGGDMFGKNKDYKIDPPAAISLQKKIGHTAEALRKLIEDASKGKIRAEVIEPLSPEDN